jgi:hypothetical protein
MGKVERNGWYRISRSGHVQNDTVKAETAKLELGEALG